MKINVMKRLGVAAWFGWLTSLSLHSLAVGQTVPHSAAQAKEKTSNMDFIETEQGEYQFDTGVLRGKLRADGKSFGLSSVVHLPSGITLSRGYGIFSHYRAFVSNARFGTAAWEWPSTARLLDDGGVEVCWLRAKDRPFEMKAVYRWHDPSTLDLETVVKAQKDLRHFEVFLASYFEDIFTNSLVFVRENPEAAGKAGFLAAKESFGDWLMFPRDPAAVQLIKDGRWAIEPHPVDWVVMPEFGKPLGLRRDPRTGTAAVFMAPPEDCFALSSPHQTEGHYSLYLSLFGRTIRTGEVARARSRLWIAQGPSDQQVLDHYRTYLNELGRGEGATTGAGGTAFCLATKIACIPIASLPAVLSTMAGCIAFLCPQIPQQVL